MIINQVSPIVGSHNSIFAELPAHLVKVSKIIIHADTFVNSIQFVWQCNHCHVAGSKHGGIGGKEHTISLASDEYITKISGRSEAFLYQLTFYTNKTFYGPYGGCDGDEFPPIIIPPNNMVTGIIGKTGAYLDAFGVAWGPII